MKLEVGKIYKSREDQLVQISRALDENDVGWNAGFRFTDKDRNTYKPNGSWSMGTNKTPKDLVSEAI